MGLHTNNWVWIEIYHKEMYLYFIVCQNVLHIWPFSLFCVQVYCWIVSCVHLHLYLFLVMRKRSVICIISMPTNEEICNQGATSGAGTAYPSGAPEFTPGFQWRFVLLNLQFYVYVLQIFVCLFVLFLFYHCVVCSSSIY